MIFLFFLFSVAIADFNCYINLVLYNRLCYKSHSISCNKLLSEFSQECKDTYMPYANAVYDPRSILAMKNPDDIYYKLVLATYSFQTYFKLDLPLEKVKNRVLAKQIVNNPREYLIRKYYSFDEVHEFLKINYMTHYTNVYYGLLDNHEFNKLQESELKKSLLYNIDVHYKDYNICRILTEYDISMSQLVNKVFTAQDFNCYLKKMDYKLGYVDDPLFSLTRLNSNVIFYPFPTEAPNELVLYVNSLIYKKDFRLDPDSLVYVRSNKEITTNKVLINTKTYVDNLINQVKRPDL